MKKKNAIVKRIGAGIAAAACITVISTAGVENVYGAAVKNVAVTVPSFGITLNETNVDNSHRQYPLLTYKGITYFPLTYSDPRFLGVEFH